LRERLDDIPLLAQDFLRHHPIAVQKKITQISPAAMDRLMQHSWPGNVRELQNVLEKAVILTKSRILNPADIPLEPIRSATDALDNNQISTNVSLNEWIREQEKQYLIQKLRAFRGRIDLTAKSSGVDVRTIHRKMQLYGLDKRKFDRKNLPRRLHPEMKSPGNP
jgi:DNA-binding NtrC family response regulator